MLQFVFIDFTFAQSTCHTRSFSKCVSMFISILLTLIHCAAGTSVECANRCSCAYVWVNFESACAYCIVHLSAVNIKQVKNMSASKRRNGPMPAYSLEFSRYNLRALFFLLQFHFKESNRKRKNKISK